jgi:hypothetical protein
VKPTLAFITSVPGWLYAAATVLRPETVAQWIILAAAVVGALGVLHAKVVLPTIAFSRRLTEGVEAMLASPDRFARIERRLDAGSKRMARIEKRLSGGHDSA